MSFPSFTTSDFSAFDDKKQKSKKYNVERQQVWQKMKSIRDFVDTGLKRKGISLQGKVSNYWPNMHNRNEVTGIWIGYSDREKKYYEYPHLSVGIYDGYIFTGLVINESAVEYQETFAKIVESQSDFFLKYYKALDEDRRVIWYHDLKILGNPSKSHLKNLAEKISKDWGWLSIGEFFNENEYFDEPEQLLWIILDTFETLAPLLAILVDKDMESTKKKTRMQESWDEGDEYDESDLSIHIARGTIKKSQAHKKLSRKFRAWIKKNHSAKIRKERKGIDVEFMLGKERVCAELKTLSEGNVKTQIRNAMGQLLEYNYYPGRRIADQWVIVTDSVPAKKDFDFIDILRNLLPKPLILIWRSKQGFNCHPEWP